VATALASGWWVIALRGLCAVLLGIAAFALPGVTLIALVVLFGVYAFADGLLAVVAAARAVKHDRPWWPLVVEGVVGIAIGVLTFFWPDLTVMTLLYLIAAWAILTGILEIVAALRLRREIAGEWLLAVAGVLSIAFGLYVLANPLAGALAVIAIIGAFALVFGIVLIALGWRLRSVPHTQRGPRGQVTGNSV
jgi:uncharacterized membrane protein HdeD (DUF308 family)